MAFFQEMKKSGVIVAPLIKSYFDKEAVNNPEKQKKNRKKCISTAIVATIICVPIIAIVVTELIYGVFLIFDNSNLKTDTEVVENVKINTYTYGNISIDLPEVFKKAPKKNESDEYDLYLNHGDGYIYEVHLEETSLHNTESSNEGYNHFKNLYVEYLNDSYNVLSNEDCTIDGKKTFKLSMIYKDEAKYKYIFYGIFNGNTFEMVIFYNYDELGLSSINSFFEEEVSKYMTTIKIK